MASPIFPSHFLHAKFLYNFGVTHFTPTHLLWIHLPHCTHKTELIFTLKLQMPDGSTILLDIPSFVMPRRTITFIFPRLAFKPLLSKASFHYKNLFLRPSNVSLIGTKSSAYSNSLITPSLAHSMTTSTTNAKRKGDSTDPWCIPTLTSNSSDNSVSTLTLVLATSYRLINLMPLVSKRFTITPHCSYPQHRIHRTVQHIA